MIHPMQIITSSAYFRYFIPSAPGLSTYCTTINKQSFKKNKCNYDSYWKNNLIWHTETNLLHLFNTRQCIAEKRNCGCNRDAFDCL
jgi:hypothetical protein